ncbi:MAG TPA: DUF1622 domain-containing protein [Vicinamibacterales bacterium]|nr:DUF1622 domain-containing protein [Vicinamibacterales bacterium]
MLHGAARAISLFIEGVAMLVVTYGAIDGCIRLLWLAANPSLTRGTRKNIWQGFAMWLLLGLEFELAADIIRSVVSPSWKEIGELGAIAVIRTFLNYFLEQDIERAARTEPA